MNAGPSDIEVRRAISARFSSANPELDNGFAEHVPMGADALLAPGASAAPVFVAAAAKVAA